MKTGLRPMTWAVVGAVVFAAATLTVIVLSALSAMGHACEVCMTFRGRTECREAVGNTPEEATRTATENACAVLGARGMTLAVECHNTPPASVSCDGGGR